MQNFRWCSFIYENTDRPSTFSAVIFNGFHGISRGHLCLGVSHSCISYEVFELPAVSNGDTMQVRILYVSAATLWP